MKIAAKQATACSGGVWYFVFSLVDCKFAGATPQDDAVCQAPEAPAGTVILDGWDLMSTTCLGGLWYLSSA
jgi:hypothetical protein